MKLKFYLRGIGLGIIVTALVLHFTLASSDSAMSDEQIKQRAMELGMIENTVPNISKNTNKEESPPRVISFFVSKNLHPQPTYIHTIIYFP